MHLMNTVGCKEFLLFYERHSLEAGFMHMCKKILIKDLIMYQYLTYVTFIFQYSHRKTKCDRNQVTSAVLLSRGEVL